MPRRDSRSTAFLLLLAATFQSLVPTAQAACPGGQAPALGTPTNYSVGTSNDGLTVGDFNEDGILDFAVSVGSGTQIRVMLGLGTGGVGSGGFGLGTLYNTESFPIGIDNADLNGDGRLDLVVANRGSNTVSVLMGLGSGGVGNGTFSPQVSYFAGTAPHHLLLADFNEDGIQDIAVANNGVQSLSVLLGQGTGGIGNGAFAVPLTLVMNNLGTGLAAADVDGDGIIDLLGTEYTSGTIALFRGLGSGGIGNGTFASAVHISAGPEPYDIEAADFNHDNKIDLMVSNSGAGGLRHLRGSGTGTFVDQGNVTSGGIGDVETGDFDQDGNLDLFVVSPTANTLTLFRGDALGGFTNIRQIAVANFPAVVAPADFNEDGYLDAVSTNYTSSTVSVMVTECVTGPTSYQIVGVRDVPRDQGGRAYVTWNRHPADILNGAVTGYRVWRRIGSSTASRTAAVAGVERRVTRNAAEVVYWEAAATLPAQRFVAYAYTADMPQDSMSGSNPHTAFFITATTSNLDVFYDTPVDSGYSVDNLPPLPPSQVNGLYLSGQVKLSWEPNGEPDLSGYVVHRGNGPFFVPSEANRIATTGSAAFDDGAGTPSSYYKVAAIDVHGNVGAFVLVEPNGPVGIELALISSDPRPGDVQLVWYADAATMPLAVLERREGESMWQPLAQGSPDASGRLEFHDTTAEAGGQYTYRLSWTNAAGNHTSAEVLIQVPGLALTLAGARPHPAPANSLTLQFTLRDGTPAMLELYDAAGRRVAHRAVGAMGAGPHAVSFANARLSPGVYLARLSQGSDEKRTRVVVVR